ncbi:MAG: dihydrofolate reductase family protein [Chitinophagaceae bacterium]
MRDLTLIVQTSLDGFVAGSNGEFDNFLGGEENLEFVCSLTDDADAALFGRVSYQLLNSGWPTAASKPGATKNEIKYSEWYNAVLKFVLSKTLAVENSENTRVISKNVETEINYIKQQPGKTILMFGSPAAARSLFELSLVDSFWIIIHPVIFGEGIPFFRGRKNIIKLGLLASKQLSNGTLCHKYSVNNHVE